MVRAAAIPNDGDDLVQPYLAFRRQVDQGASHRWRRQNPMLDERRLGRHAKQCAAADRRVHLGAGLEAPFTVRQRCKLQTALDVQALGIAQRRQRTLDAIENAAQ